MDFDKQVIDRRAGRQAEEYVVVLVGRELVEVIADFEILRIGYGIVDVDVDILARNIFDIAEDIVFGGSRSLGISAADRDMIGLALLELNLTVVRYVDIALGTTHDRAASSLLAVELAVFQVETGNTGNDFDEFLFGYEVIQIGLVKDICRIGRVCLVPVGLDLRLRNHARDVFYTSDDRIVDICVSRKTGNHLRDFGNLVIDVRNRFVDIGRNGIDNVGYGKIVDIIAGLFNSNSTVR